MKPSERLTEIYTAKADELGRHIDAAFLTQHALSVYLDEEAERRAAFEASVLQALQYLGLPLHKQAAVVAAERGCTQ